MSFARLLVVGACFVLSASAYATGSDHYSVEIGGAASAGITITNSDPSRTTIFINGDVAVPLMEPMLDARADVEFLSTSSNSVTSTGLGVLVGPQVNLGDPNPRNAFFLGGEVGINYEKIASASETKFEYLFRGGKRFSLGSSVAYAPFVTYSKAADHSSVIRIVPLSFSFFL